MAKRNPYISIYRYVDIETGDELNDSTNLVFIDLHNFTKKEEECDSLEDIWMYSIKNMHSLLLCPEKFKGTEIEELFVKSELAKMTVEQRLKYEEGIMTHNDILNSIAEQLEDAKKEAAAAGLAEGRAEGWVEGCAEGLAEGVESGRAEVIKKLVAGGVPVEQISSLLGMPADDIMKLVSADQYVAE